MYVQYECLWQVYISFNVDVYEALPRLCFISGELTAYCMGPHQVAFCELQDNKDGTFNLGMKAQESGKHVLQVKYGGEHVQGRQISDKQNLRFIMYI